jgi:hypothetical protein
MDGEDLLRAVSSNLSSLSRNTSHYPFLCFIAGSGFPIEASVGLLS